MTDRTTYWVRLTLWLKIDIKIPVIIEFAETVLKILNTGDAHNYLLSRQPEKISYYVSYDYPHEASVYHIYWCYYQNLNFICTNGMWTFSDYYWWGLTNSLCFFSGASRNRNLYPYGKVKKKIRGKSQKVPVCMFIPSPFSQFHVQPNNSFEVVLCCGVIGVVTIG